MNDVFMVGMATFVLVYLIKNTAGPFDMFLKLKQYIGLTLPVVENDVIVNYMVDSDPSGFFAKLIACHWCFSTWVSAILSLFYWFINQPNWIYSVFVWLASLGVAGILYEVVDDG